MTSSQNNVVCDNGAAFVKCGLAGDEFPTAVFPCMAERPLLRYEESLGDQELQDRVSGEPCSQLRYRLEVAHPFSNDIMQSRDDIGHIWDLTLFNRLHIDPSETKMLLTDPQRNHEKMLQQFCSGVHSNACCAQTVHTR